VFRTISTTRACRAVCALVVLGAALVLTSASTAAKPKALPGGPVKGLHPAFVPFGVSTGRLTVMLQVAGDPVTVVEANAATPLTRDQKRQLRDQLRSKQTGIEQQVAAAGGTVLGDYQSAYNGIKALVPRGKTKALAAIAGVVAVHPLQPVRLSNIHGVPLIGAPEVWDGASGVRGEGIKIAVIDTGIDYTHADFGGSGNPADYESALATDTLPANPVWFGPNAPRVKGGTDLVGDDYDTNPNNPTFQPVPHPDPNPLDCNGHGTHVTGTAAGSGVLADGSTYPGPYNPTTVSSNSWNVGPGVAPKADIYSIKIFGCEGDTNEEIDAIEWAVDHDMDVINMSLGSPFGSPDNPVAVAASNASKHGVIVVAAAGNAGHAPYITDSPGVGDGVLSVAANDPNAGNPGANVALSTGPSLTAVNSNGATFSNGLTLPVKVLFSAPGVVSLGCDPAEYTGVTGKLVVTARGACARVARAIFGQQAGAAAVMMINSTDELPPFEGNITQNPDTGEQFDVTIPFLGVKSSDAAALIAADGGTASLTNIFLPNPAFRALAGFTSGGPRSGDSVLKPDVTAPGVNIASAGMGTGTGAAFFSGTSMASPHAAGTAVLVKQSNPSWKKAFFWRAAVANTAHPSLVADYKARLAGTGFVQAPDAVKTKVVALTDKERTSLSFGFAELDKDFSQKGQITLHNLGDYPASFDVSDRWSGGRPHSVSLKSTEVTIPAHGKKDVQVELNVPVATAGSGDPFADVSGQIAFTPTGWSNHGVVLRVPYYLVPQATSRISTKINTGKLKKDLTAVATVTNDKKAGGFGFADWYAWGLSDKKDHGLGSNDLAAAGVQSFPNDGVLAFALETKHRWSNAGENEFDVFVDVNRDDHPDYDVIGIDEGAILEGVPDGTVVVVVVPLDSSGNPDFDNATLDSLADAPTNSNTIVLPVLFEQLCIPGFPCLDETANPRFSYSAESFGLTDDTTDSIDGSAVFNPFTPAISTGMFDVLDPGQSADETVTIDGAEWNQSPALGLMIVSHQNPSGKDEAQLIKVKIKIK
jgi:minor extracellular serine protease Vpr